MKKRIAVILTLVIIIILIILIATGFKKRSDVVLTDYSVSEDGTKLTLKVAVSSSMGYTRSLKIKQGGDNKYITFYSTFGGFNSKLGAKDTFDIEVDSMCSEIYFYKGDGGYNLVLEKDKTTNKWKQPEKYNEEDEELIGFTDIPQNFEVEDAIERGYFVIDGRKDKNKIYNKDVLDSFIENTNINSKNRKPDKIRIVNYNYDGYPTIYEVEYKVLDKKYINKEQQEANETGYVLTVDASRNNIMPRSIVVNDDIPGEFYGITVDEDVGINAAIIKLSLYAIIDYVEEVEPYKDIEITRYLLDDKVVNTEKN